MDRPIRTREDADSIREDIEAVHDAYFAQDYGMDLGDFLDKLEDRGYDLGDSMLTGAVLRIMAIIKELRKRS